MFLNVKLVLRKHFIKIFLEGLESNSVSLFMLSVVVAIFLQAVICKMHIVVFVIQRVFITASSQVAFSVHIKLLFM
jgi:hypothetical protein